MKLIETLVALAQVGKLAAYRITSVANARLAGKGGKVTFTVDHADAQRVIAARANIDENHLVLLIVVDKKEVDAVQAMINGGIG